MSSSSSTTQLTAFAQQTSNELDNRPNILAIMGDDFGWSDIGSFGSEISTPNFGLGLRGGLGRPLRNSLLSLGA